MLIEQIIDFNWGAWASWPNIHFYNRLFLWKKKISQENLRVDYFKIAFNSVGAIISTLWHMGSLEKGCFRLNVFVQLSSWIYAEMKKN